MLVQKSYWTAKICQKCVLGKGDEGISYIKLSLFGQQLISIRLQLQEPPLLLASQWKSVVIQL